MEQLHPPLQILVTLCHTKGSFQQWHKCGNCQDFAWWVPNWVTFLSPLHPPSWIFCLQLDHFILLTPNLTWVFMVKYSNTSRKLVPEETRDCQDLRASDAFLAAPSPCSIFCVPNFSLILILLCDLISIYAREYRVFFFERRGQWESADRLWSLGICRCGTFAEVWELGSRNWEA